MASESQDKKGRPLKQTPVTMIVPVFAASAAVFSLLGAVTDSLALFRIAQWLCFAALFLTALKIFIRVPDPEWKPVSAAGLFAAALLILLLTFAGYANTLSAPFQDGDEYIHLYDARNMLENFSARDYFDFLVLLKNGDAEQLIRPLLTFPFVLVYALFKTNALGFHIMHVGFHALAAVALFLSVFFMIGRIGPGMIAGAAFALHPALSRPVSWVANLSKSPSILVFFLSLLFFVLYRRYKQRKLFLALCAVFLLVDVGLWELGAVLPLLFVCVDFLFFRSQAYREQRKNWLAPYVLTFGLVVLYAANIYFRIAFLNLETGRQYLADRLSATGPGWIDAFRALLDGLLRPFHQGVFDPDSLPWLFFISIAGLAAIVIAGFFQKDFDGRLPLLGLAILLLTYLPAKGSAQIEYEYLTRSRLLIGPAAGLGVALDALLGASRPLRILGVILLCAMGVVVSFNNRAQVRIAAIQDHVNSALFALLSNYPMNRPAVFLLNNPDTPEFREPEDFIETAYAARRFYHPEFGAIWIQPAKAVLTEGAVQKDPIEPRLGVPIFFEISDGFSHIDDATARYEKTIELMLNFKHEAADALLRFEPDVYPPYPAAARHGRLILAENQQRAVVLDGDLYFITRDRMTLMSVPYEKWLESFQINR